jgi:hypothetical protein
MATTPTLLRTVLVSAMPDTDWPSAQTSPGAANLVDVTTARTVGVVYVALDNAGAVVNPSGTVDIRDRIDKSGKAVGLRIHELLGMDELHVVLKDQNFIVSLVEDMLKEHDLAEHDRRLAWIDAVSVISFNVPDGSRGHNAYGCSVQPVEKLYVKVQFLEAFGNYFVPPRVSFYRKADFLDAINVHA